MPGHSTHYRLGKKKHQPCCPKCKIPFAERVPRSTIVKFLFGWLPLTKYVCYRCKSKHYTIHKRSRAYPKYERSQAWSKSPDFAIGIDKMQLIDNSPTIIKERSADILPRLVENKNDVRSSYFHQSEKADSLLQKQILGDTANFDEKQAYQISTLLVRMDDLEQELFFYRKLREGNISLTSSLNLAEATPNQNINEKANKNPAICREFEIKDSKTVTINLCLNIDGKLNIE
jgi:hypothetical protein